ncbi:hypothetical protein [Anaerolentibacter hominis]|uniref:hypothetical protein n=1 Tax=Anaerolentibacter hominis TaxID=3079009 RepID=UPI0031B842E7
MPEKTANYNLVKPDQDDFYDIQVTNENIDKIDELIKKNEIAVGDTNTQLSNVRRQVDNVQSDVAELEKKAHVHDNKTVLDGIAGSDITNWNDANAKKHVHDNKATLDGITDSSITNWNDTNTKKHIHENKATLDGILQGDVDKMRSLETDFNTLRRELETSIDTEMVVINEGFQAKITTFNADGSISESGDAGTKVTVFNSDGSIIENFTNQTGKSISKTTSFLADGSIQEVIN